MKDEQTSPDPKEERPRFPWATLVASAAIIASVLVFAVREELPILRGADSQFLPFLAALVGVTLYIMSSAKTYRERFDRRYLPDYFYRAAQSVVYLYVILAILARQGGEDVEGYSFASWPPVLIGLLVGMFILHVEKAMEGLGQRFEEVLSGILPRSLGSPTSRERQMTRLKADHKYQEIRAQTELLASQVRDPAVLEAWRNRIEEVAQVFADGEEGAIQDEVNRLAAEYEQLKVSLRQSEMTVAEILGRENGLDH